MTIIAHHSELEAAAKQTLAQLIAHNTVKPNPTRPLIAAIAEDLQAHGIDVQTVLSKEDPSQHAGLIATLGPKEDGGIALSGHIDVVPVKDQPWIIAPDPFHLTEKNGRLYGRGTCDMKGFVATGLAGLVHHAGLRGTLTKPIRFFLSYDEETGFKSIEELLTAGGPKPRLAIIGEPTELQVVTAHKAALGIKADIVGHACHSKDPRDGINAGDIAVELWLFAKKIFSELRERDSGHEYTDGFDPPYGTLDPTVLHVGTAANVIPALAHLEIFGRPILENQIGPIFTKFRAEAERLVHAYTREVKDEDGNKIIAVPGIKLRTMGLPPLRFDPKNAALAFLRAAGFATAEHVSYMTEASIFQKHGIPAVVCGPGSIDQAHKPDEYLSVDQFARGVAFVDQVIRRAATPG